MAGRKKNSFLPASPIFNLLYTYNLTMNIYIEITKNLFFSRLQDSDIVKQETGRIVTILLPNLLPTCAQQNGA